MRGEDWAKAGAEGAVDGVFKVAVGTVTDGLAGDFPKTVLGKGSTNILPAVKNVLVSKTAVVKTASGFIDEFGVKPKVVQPIKDSLKPYFQKK